MSKIILFVVILCSYVTANAAFVPAAESKPLSQKTISLSEFEALTGKKLNWMERLQYKKLQRLTAKGKKAAVWNAEELTEGFQFLPFIGSILTLGILYLVMIFTAKDANALRWARWGALIVLTVATAVALIGSTQGY
jgi:heme A synthase